MATNTPQLSKNLSSANKLIKSAVGPTPAPKIDPSKPKLKKPEEPSKGLAKSLSMTKKPPEDIETKIEEDIPKPNENIEENVVLEDENEKKPSEKEIINLPKPKPIEKKTSEMTTKKAPIKKKIDDLEKGVTSLEKIVNKPEDISEKSQKNTTPLVKTVRKKRGKNTGNRQNVWESHDFEGVIRKMDALSFGDDEFLFNDMDYMKEDEEQKNVDTEKFFGGFQNESLGPVMDTLEWVEMQKIAQESWAVNFINFKTEDVFRQKIIIGAMNNISVLKYFYYLFLMNFKLYMCISIKKRFGFCWWASGAI